MTARLRSRQGFDALVVALALASAAPIAVGAPPTPAAGEGASSAGTAAGPVVREWRYKVATGDTLIALAAAYLDDPDDWPALQRLNQVANPRRLEPGSIIRMPFAWLRREATVAEVVFVQGQVSVQRLGEAARQPMVVGMNVRPADTLRTGAQSSVSLRFADGSRLLMVPDSQLTIEDMLVYGRTGIVDTRLRVERGSVDTRVVPNVMKAPAFEVRTPAVNLGVRGTDFRVRVEPDGEAARLEVLAGRVGASNEPASGTPVAEAVEVDAGYGTVVERDRPVPAPQVLLPAPALALSRVPLTRLALNWGEVDGARGYRAQVFADAEAGTRPDALLLDRLVDMPAADWSADMPDLPDGRYLLKVRAVDGAGLEGIDANAAFELAIRPPAPALASPPPGLVVAGDRMPLRWEPVERAQGYRLQVAAGGDFEAAPQVQTVSGTEATLALPPGRYAWRVAGVLGEGPAARVGAYGEPRWFDLRAVPEPASWEEPQFSATTLLLRWRPTTAGQGVQLQLASDPAFERLLVDERTWGAQLALPRPPAGSYHLRLRSWLGDAPAGEFGAVRSIEVPAAAWWERWTDDTSASPR
jgi:hypothetical protein